MTCHVRHALQLFCQQEPFVSVILIWKKKKKKKKKETLAAAVNDIFIARAPRTTGQAYRNQTIGVRTSRGSPVQPTINGGRLKRPAFMKKSLSLDIKYMLGYAFVFPGLSAI